MITRNGREAAVLLSAADLAELEETLSVLSDPQALADIREADAARTRKRMSFAASTRSAIFGGEQQRRVRTHRHPGGRESHRGTVV